MTLQEIKNIDTVGFCTRVLDEYRKMYEYSNGTFESIEALYNSILLKGWKRKIRLINKFPNITRSTDITDCENKQLNSLKIQLDILKPYEYKLLETGVKNLDALAILHIETFLTPAIEKRENESIDLFNERLQTTALPKLDYITHRLNEELKEPIPHLQTLQHGNLPMFLDDFPRLMAFVVDIKQIQFIQYLDNLQYEFLGNPTKNTAEPVNKNLLTNKQRVLLLFELSKTNILNIPSENEINTTDLVEILGELINMPVTQPVKNSTIYGLWQSVKSVNDHKKVNTPENRKAIERFLQTIEIVSNRK